MAKIDIEIFIYMYNSHFPSKRKRQKNKNPDRDIRIDMCEMREETHSASPYLTQGHRHARRNSEQQRGP